MAEAMTMTDEMRRRIRKQMAETGNASEVVVTRDERMKLLLERDSLKNIDVSSLDGKVVEKFMGVPLRVE